ncbi:hypothetical protein K449DRAFT_434033 [Hypoxylon sp. EC38]|nr:hypothetical protein K449DRAFT_434033 [Hypoxylon sp. EC38]
MKFHSVLLLLVGTLHEATADSSLLVREHQPDSQTIAAYEATGQCFYYYVKGKANWNKALQPCIKYCANHGGHGYAQCDSSSFKNIDIEKNNGMPKYVDDDGFPWVAAPCQCENEAVETITTEIIELVAEALEQLDNILCAVFVSAIMEIAEIGLMFVPGGQAISGVGKVIQYAKSAFENGMNAAGFYTDWVGKACGVPNWNFSLDSMFMDMVNAPDSMMGPNVASTGCLRKNKSKCNKRDPKPDPKSPSQVHKRKGPKKGDPSKKTSKKEDPPKKTSKKEDPPEKTSKKEDPPKTTSKKNDPPKTTEDPKACKQKRDPYKPEPVRLVKKFGDVEERKEEECNNGKTTTIVHRTTTDSAIGYYVQDRKDMPKITCKKEHTQACYHYRSVMSRWSKTRSMTEWTCQQTTSSWSKGIKSGWGHNGGATAIWGATAIATLRGKTPRAQKGMQHWFPWANGYVYRENEVDDKGKIMTHDNKLEKFDGCDRDEFPPRYFWPGDKKVPDLRQWVRFIPAKQNEGAGQMWKGFCNNHNAASTDKNKQTYVVSSNLKSDKPVTRVEQPKGKDKTIHSTVKISTLRAIFSISDFEGLKPNDDGLKENPCYPKVLIDDPGWALLTDDEWYKEHPESAKNVGNYRKAPSKALVDAAKAKIDAAKKNGEKLDAAGPRDLAWMKKQFHANSDKDLWNKLVGTGDGQIPEELWGVLPSIPKFPKPKKRSFLELAATNDTLTREDRDADDLDWDGHEDDVDQMDDEELRRWLEDYEEMMRRMYEDDEDYTESRTTPAEVAAEPTLVPRNERELIHQPAPATPRSNSLSKMPHPTQV